MVTLCNPKLSSCRNCAKCGKPYHCMRDCSGFNWSDGTVSSGLSRFMDVLGEGRGRVPGWSRRGSELPLDLRASPLSACSVPRCRRHFPRARTGFFCPPTQTHTHVHADTRANIHTLRQARGCFLDSTWNFLNLTFFFFFPLESTPYSSHIPQGNGKQRVRVSVCECGFALLVCVCQ